MFLCVSTFLKLNRANSGKNDDKKGGNGDSKSEASPESGKTAVVFSLKNEVGGLVKVLNLFQVNVKCHYLTLTVTVCPVPNPSPALKHPQICLWIMCSKKPQSTKLCKEGLSAKQRNKQICANCVLLIPR